MAFQLKFAVTLGSNCKSFVITQNTGTYDDPDNLTGWGTPNPEIADIDTSTITIQNLTTETVYDALTITSSATVGNETTYTTEDLSINGVSIGDVTLPDGQYCFTYNVVMNDETEYENSVSKLFLCETCCKIKTMACEIDLECGCCNEPCAAEIWKFLQAFTELKVIEYSAYCSSSSNLNNKIKSLQSFLTNNDCKTC